MEPQIHLTWRQNKLTENQDILKSIGKFKNWVIDNSHIIGFGRKLLVV